MKKLNFLFKKASTLALVVAMGITLLPGLVQTVQVAKAAGAREYENPPCYDITGVTTPLNVGGVPNSGTMDFDDAGVAASYQACVRMSSNAANAVPAHLEGWVWDNNLGWVSLYCGADGLNLGVACGAIQYSVQFTVTGGPAPDFSTAKLSGYAWGDNVGYISFNSAFHQTAPIASGLNKGLIDTTMGTASYHAWADSVGWLDLRGMHMYWYDTDPPMPDPTVNTSIYSSQDAGLTCDLDSGCSLTDVNKIPDADGSQFYKIKVPFMDGGVNIPSNLINECPTSTIGMYTTGANIYCAKISIAWEDDVDFDQTTVASQSQVSPKYNTTSVNSGGAGAVGKPLNGMSGADAFSYNGAGKWWEFNVRSYAPTSDANKMDGMPNEKFYYAGGLGGYNRDLTDQNRLVLKEMKLMFFKYSTDGVTPGTCIYGTINSGTSSCEMRTYIGNVPFSFNPLVSMSKLAYKKAGNWINFIDVGSIENQLDFDELMSMRGAAMSSPQADLYIGLENVGLGNFEMNWVNDFADAVASSFTMLPIVNTAENAFIGKIFSDNPGESISTDAGPYVYSKIHYDLGGKTVTYFGGKLPRIKAGLLLNPVAKVQGNVYVTDFAQKAADFTIRSLGNVSSNLRREAVVRNVAKYISGLGTPVTGNHSVADLNNVNGLSSLAGGKVYYLKNGNLTLDCSGTCTFNKNVTFIVENGNIKVNSDLKSSDGKAQIGLIALRDLSSNNLTQGFVYLDKNVTWLNNVQIYADRLLTSYDKASAAFDTNGLPKTTGDDYARQILFNNQLVIEGTLSSQNGIGNASRAKPVDESGKEITGATSACSDYGNATISGICRARVADLNYLRYFGPGLVICTGAEGAGAVANVPQDQALKAGGVDPAQGCNPNYAGYEVVATDLYTHNAATDLVSGSGGGVRSVYFTANSLPDTLANEYPVNFFYKPIAKDLAGFEVDQNFNQIAQ